MKLFARISLLPILVCLFVLPSQAQKRPSKPKIKAGSASSPQTICQGDAIPKGFVVVEAKRTTRCVELTVKKPAAAEIVCDGSPIPDGYVVVKQHGELRCSAASLNPLTNALMISSDDAPATPTKKAASRRSDEDENEESADTVVKSAIGDNVHRARIESILEQRAEESQRQARLGNAVHNHEVQVGMTKAQVLESWGRPSDTSTRITPRGRSDVWTYNGENGHAYVYFSEGIVTDFSFNN